MFLLFIIYNYIHSIIVYITENCIYFIHFFLFPIILSKTLLVRMLFPLLSIILYYIYPIFVAPNLYMCLFIFNFFIIIIPLYNGLNNDPLYYQPNKPIYPRFLLYAPSYVSYVSIICNIKTLYICT